MVFQANYGLAVRQRRERRAYRRNGLNQSGMYPAVNNAVSLVM